MVTTKQITPSAYCMPYQHFVGGVGAEVEVLDRTLLQFDIRIARNLVVLEHLPSRASVRHDGSKIL